MIELKLNEIKIIHPHVCTVNGFPVEEIKKYIIKLEADKVKLNHALNDLFKWFNKFEPNVKLAQDWQKALEEK